MRLTLTLIAIVLLMSGCSLTQYFETGRDEVEKISTGVTNAAMYQICSLIRSRDEVRIFNTPKKAQARADICENKINVIRDQGASEGSVE